MVATAALIFFSLADHRTESAPAPRPEAAAGLEQPAATPILPASACCDSDTQALAASPRDRLVVASIRPETQLIKAVMRSREEAAAAAGKGEPPAQLQVAQAAPEQPVLSDAAAGDVAPAVPSVSAEPSAPALPETHATTGSPSSDNSRRHALPFDPLKEPALAGDQSSREAARKDFQALIAADEMHTVRAVREIAHEVKKGETLSTVLARNGCNAEETAKWVAAVRVQHDPNRIYAGQTIKLLLDMPERRLRRISIEIGAGDVLTIEDAGRSDLVSRKKSAPLESSVRVVEGDITSSLYQEATGKGVPDRVISEAAEVLGWEINLGRDLQPGARYRMTYEQTMRLDTREATAGRLLAIELLNSGKRYEGFYFATKDGKTSGYYKRNGESLGRAFLRYPVAFSRISSKFSSARYHPVLKRSRPHYGVDFAAPTGTPVKAVADGTVVMAGWNGGNGRFVKIRHDKQYESGYAHLSRIASGMRPGARVRQGQVIGYVGSTGLATGPHLHFAMYSNGKYIDPLQASLPRTMPLTSTALAQFKSQVARVEQVYASNGLTAFGLPRPATAAATVQQGR